MGADKCPNCKNSEIKYFFRPFCHRRCKKCQCVWREYSWTDKPIILRKINMQAYDIFGIPIITEFAQDLPDKIFNSKKEAKQAYLKKYGSLCVDKYFPPDKKTTEYTLVQDDYSHWYLIPRELRDEFEKWMAAWNDYEYKGDNAVIWDSDINFNEYRLDNPFKLIIKDFEIEE